MLANSVGVIDQGYTGEIKVALIKIDPNAEDLRLPIRLVQIIPRKCIGMFPHKPKHGVPSLLQTQRGAGGFGSTNKDVVD
jgi:dUTPase